MSLLHLAPFSKVAPIVTALGAAGMTVEIGDWLTQHPDHASDLICTLMTKMAAQGTGDKTADVIHHVTVTGDWCHLVGLWSIRSMGNSLYELHDACLADAVAISTVVISDTLQEVRPGLWLRQLPGISVAYSLH